MNLYLISQTENEDYETYDSAVVCAESKKDAARIYPWVEDPDEYEDPWISSHSWASSPKNVKVKYIGVAAEDIILGSIICASFNAG